MLDDLMTHPAPGAADDGVPVPLRTNSPRRVRSLAERIRPSSRLGRRLIGSRAARLEFLDLLVRHGDPGLAADRLGVSLVQLFRLRDADPVFAAEWQAAVGYAWERLEARVLADLMIASSKPAGDKTAVSALLDTKLAGAILARREKPVTRVHGPVVESASVARLRAEIRELAGVAG